MIKVPERHVRFYEDGPWWPQTPTQQAAEQAYREAFLAAAHEAARWDKVDEVAIRQAWDERRRARERGPGHRAVRCALWRRSLDRRTGHLPRRPRGRGLPTRGRVHGLEFVRQCRDELVKAGVAEDRIGPEIIVPWLKHVAEWVACDIDPERISIPPRPDDCLTERQHRMLEQAKKAIAACDPKKPHAILQRLADVTRELLEWLWPGRIPLGKLTLLAGDPGLGKSFVTLDLASRVSTGAAWPDSYRELVAGIATGEEPNPSEVERLLSSARKSVDDLRQDVERYQHRMALKAMINSLPGLEAERREIDSQIAAADRVLEAAEKQHDESTAPLYESRRELDLAIADASRASAELMQTCDDTDLRRELDELNTEARRLDEQHRSQADRATYVEEKARSEHQRAERELTLGDTEARREVAQRYRKEADSARREAKRLEKAHADLAMRREQLEARMRQA